MSGVFQSKNCATLNRQGRLSSRLLQMGRGAWIHLSSIELKQKVGGVWGESVETFWRVMGGGKMVNGMVQHTVLLLGSQTFSSMIKPPVFANWSPVGLSFSSLTETGTRGYCPAQGFHYKGIACRSPWERYSRVVKLARYFFKKFISLG